MQGSKFISLLGTLDRKEVAHYFKYLKQNHGKENIALQVFEYIRKCYPELQENKKLQIEYAHQKIFKQDIHAHDYNRTRLLNALSDLHLWLKDFLLAQKALGEGIESRILWLRILQERGLKEEFSRQAVQFYEEKELSKEMNTSDHLETLAANYFQFQNLSLSARSPDIQGLEHCMERMKQSIELQHLKMACFVKNLNELLPPKHQQEAAAAPVPAAEPPLLLLYREIYSMLMTAEEEHFAILEHEFMAYADQISPTELHLVVKYLHNYVAAQSRKGKDVAFINRIHRLNQLGLEKGVFNFKGEVSAQSFNNIVSLACGAKDLTWATNFVNTHFQFLPPEIAADTRLLANATILFEEGAYKKALALLESARFDRPLLVLRVRAMVLRCMFELKTEINVMLDYCTDFQLKLRANKMPKIKAVEATVQFIKFVKKLVQEKVEKPVLEGQIEKTENVYFKHWLLEKVKSYKARYAPNPRKK